MRIEVLNTGTELLLGSVLNTHLQFLAQALFPLGLRIERQVTVPDGEAIRTAVAETFGRANVVLITGGLGPTTDDITREAVAELLGMELVHDETVMAAIERRFARRNLTMSPRNRRQAQRPTEATVLHNANGTAPGLYLPERTLGSQTTPHLFLLPGPPRELQPMVTEQVLPILEKLRPARPAVEMRMVRVAGVGESAVEELIGEQLLALDLELGYCARPGEVDVRTIGHPSVLDEAERIIIEKLGPHIVSRDQRLQEKVLVDLLTARRETLACAESCTGGFLAHRITNVPGASAVFLGGYVTYANAVKTSAVGVDAGLIAQHGAVSEPVARAMAEGARKAANADYALSTTGIAGPDGGTEEKPVGTVFIGLARANGETLVERHRFPTDRKTFKDLVSLTAFEMLRRQLSPR
ncbi:MAG TPA: competence/damage-inducible protein A [Chthoniobacter sp.]|nr:competence/damage-inducible protein A [Chthoniobacter sp.]